MCLLHFLTKSVAHILFHRLPLPYCTRQLLLSSPLLCAPTRTNAGSVAVLQTMELPDYQVMDILGYYKDQDALRFPKFTLDDKTAKELFNQHENLKAALTLLKTIHKAGESGDAATKAIEESLQSIDVLHTRFIKPVLYNETITPSALNIATRVFDVAKILEKILLNLPIIDLLAVPRVNKQFRDTVYGSKKINEHMLRSPGPHFTTLGQNLPGFICQPDEYYTDSRCAHLYFHLSAQGIKLGSRCRNMFVCLPKIDSLTIISTCCDDEKAVKNKSGMKMGDVVDAAKKMREEHRHCADADWSLHAPDGTVKPEFMFRTEDDPVQLSKDDPFVSRAIYDVRSKTQDLPEDRIVKRRIIPFIKAKREGIYSEQRLIA